MNHPEIETSNPSSKIPVPHEGIVPPECDLVVLAAAVVDIAAGVTERIVNWAVARTVWLIRDSVGEVLGKLSVIEHICFVTVGGAAYSVTPLTVVVDRLTRHSKMADGSELD